ncbi:MAG: SAF domain-containing protein [candidate division WOR-3 bacterium]
MKETGLELLLKKDLKIFLVAVGLGVVSILLLHYYVSEKTKSEEMVTVVVAAKNIPEGATIEKGMLREKQIPKSVYNSHMYKPAEITTSIVGYSVKINIPEGVPILSDYLLIRKGAKLSELLSAEYHERIKQISLKGPVDYLKPEDLIDIIGTPKEGSAPPRILLPKVLVINKAGGDLLLKVSTEEALMLTQAEKVMNLSFIIRSPEDIEVDTGQVDVNFFNYAGKVREKKIQREKLIIKHY